MLKYFAGIAIACAGCVAEEPAESTEEAIQEVGGGDPNSPPYDNCYVAYGRVWCQDYYSHLWCTSFYAHDREYINGHWWTVYDHKHCPGKPLVYEEDERTFSDVSTLDGVKR